jgi:phage FluMu protein Com
MATVARVIAQLIDSQRRFGSDSPFNLTKITNSSFLLLTPVRLDRMVWRVADAYEEGGPVLPLTLGSSTGYPRPAAPIRWIDMRCIRCRRLLQKIEADALRPGKRIEIKCSHCKVINYSVGTA